MTSYQQPRNWYEKKRFIVPAFVAFLPLGIVMATASNWIMTYFHDSEPTFE
ncbi:MAG TPA: hypothetical protein V6D50_25060 [Chroococcales cyanobacterium]